MAASYPTSVWDGDSANRDSDNSPFKSPDARDWDRMIQEVAATQTQVDANKVIEDGRLAGVDDDAIDSVGTLATVTGLTVVEKGDAGIHKTIMTLDEVEIASTDGTNSATDGAWGTKKLYTFPEGHVVILGGHQVYALAALAAVTGGGTGFSDTADFGIGVGSTAVAQASAFGLATTLEDMCAEADVDLTAKTSDAIESSVNAALLPLDGSTAAVTANLNYRTLDDADHGDTADVLKVSGTVTLVWSILGND